MQKTYLFLTKPEYKPGKVNAEHDFSWSCSKSARAGDHALVYVTGGLGITYEWKVLTDAEPDKTWGYVCDVEYVGDINPPISIRELRDAIPRKDWSSPHLNFRGNRSIEIPLVGLKAIRSLRATRRRAIELVPQQGRRQTKEQIDLALQKRIALSVKDTPSIRKARLAKASKKPKSQTVTTTAFIRNADVVVEVLVRAKGRCEECGEPAPFERARDGTPYLEVHHKQMLSNGGEDTVKNAIAVCPNCHRRAHFG
jgi:5-methylcytosine-specific restriction endonuclease McrA